MPRTNWLPFSIGLAVGGLLMLLYGWENRTNFLGWEWYQVSALLAGFGLTGLFPLATGSVTQGLVLGPVLLESVRTALDMARDSSCCNLWPIGLVLVFLFALPGPVLGRVIRRLLRPAQFPRGVFVAALIAGFLFGATAPGLERLRNHSIETEQVPQLLKQIHAAEMAYQSRQSNGSFACDGKLLPGAAGKLGWTHTAGTKLYNLLFVRYYMWCSNARIP